MSRHRFIAAIDPHDVRAAADQRCETLRTHDLKERHASGGLILFTSPDTRWAPLGPTGALVGEVHRRHGTTNLDRLGDAARQSGGQLLVAEYWGDYVALLAERGESTARVLRSPSGGIHAFRAVGGTTTWIASDVEILIELGIVEPAIDWVFVAHHLAFPHLRGALTGINEVDEVHPGECMIIRSLGSERRRFWSPWRFTAPEQRFQTIDEASASLLETVTTTAQTMAKGNPTLLLELSGGIDSSVLAASLAQTGSGISAVNLVTPSPEGDERRYARLVCERTGIPLEETVMAGALDLTEPFHARTARPGIPAMLRDVDRHFIKTAKAQRIDAFVSGTGGDSVFCSLGSAAPVVDAFHAFGLGRGFWRALLDVTAVHDTNVWRTGALALRQARRRPSAWPRTSQFLCDDALPREPLSHPWLVEPEGVAAGARSHVRSILAALAHLDGYARHAVAPSMFPLLSQPVIETCLRIPTWMWVHGGRDRSIVRRTFSAALPKEVINRRGKGAMDSYCAATFQNNRDRLRPFLLDGHLASAGLLDRDDLDAYLQRRGPVRDTRFYWVLPIADVEAWLRAWLGDPR